MGHGDVDSWHAGKFGLALRAGDVAEHLCGLHDLVLRPPDGTEWLSFAGVVVHISPGFLPRGNPALSFNQREREGRCDDGFGTLSARD
eukprot:1172042-Prymnesium_polylepis.1